MLPVHIQVSDSIPWCDLEDHSSEPTCLRQSAARRSGPGCRSRHRRASAGSSWTRLSTALCLSQVRQCAVSFRSHRMTNKIVLRRPIESAQYVSIHYTERLADAGIDPSVGSVGDSYDNALAEPSMVCSRLRSSGEEDLGARWRLSSSLSSNGSTGSTIAAFSSQSAICRS